MFHRNWVWAVGLLLLMGGVPLLAAGANRLDQSDQQMDRSSQGYQSDQPRTMTRTEQQSDQMTTGDQAGHASLNRASHLIGAKVQNTRGENLGTIHDIVLTPDRTNVSYAVLAHGGSLGMGGEYFAIPWSSLQYSSTNRNFVLDVSKQDLDRARGFDKNNWPEQADMRWSREGSVSAYVPPGSEQTTEVRTEQKTETKSKWAWGCPLWPSKKKETTEYESKAGTAHEATAMTTGHDIDTRRVSKIIGMDVRNNSNDDLGTVEDVVIDTNQGHVTYGIVAYGGALGMGEKYVAVPWTAVTVSPDSRVARIDSTRQSFDAVAFASNRFPDLADRTYARRLGEHFNTQPYYETYGYVGGEAGGGTLYESWRANSEYNRKFDPKNTTTVSGTVESVSTFTPARGGAEGIRLRVRTDDGKIMTVHAGPRFWSDRQNISFSTGDRVKVTGAQADIAGRNVVLASEITKGNQTLKLRDSQGKPQWESAIPSQGRGGQLQGRSSQQGGSSGSMQGGAGGSSGSMSPSDQGSSPGTDSGM